MGSEMCIRDSCNTLSAFAGGIHLLAHVPCLYISVANPQHHLLRTLLSLCAAQCSIHLLDSFRRTSCRLSTFVSRLLSLYYPDVPHSTLGCVCMGGDSPCFGRGHCRVLINPPGRNFPCPRACGLLPLPLLGHGTCHHPCNKSPSAIAVTIVAAIAAAIADSRAAAIAGVRTYESVPLYAVPL